MNVYDFDNTIYRGDCTLDFYKYCLIHYPQITICIPKQITAFVMYKLKRINKTCFKEQFYCFFNLLHDIENITVDFWNKNDHKIKDWYKNQYEATDVVISASPYFLLKEICNRIGIKHLVASKVNPSTGEYTGMNCYGVEKVRRFNSEIGGVIDKFYTDSKSDIPMMRIAKESFWVKGSIVSKCNKEMFL